eukprot:CAMPEP_0180156946 /NCGR_PEP_ID=MMETSP0986-20121125/25905_1 /TAXON_ID=697907 /ORGANISM="non described non described, Strain CCMP2293" /LENGTH=103 /DNA_ID=CAMNT_0022106285 /DNA_START=759 /DNA_END=1066 /DNA_ORIENTATION=+
MMLSTSSPSSTPAPCTGSPLSTRRTAPAGFLKRSRSVPSANPCSRSTTANALQSGTSIAPRPKTTPRAARGSAAACEHIRAPAKVVARLSAHRTRPDRAIAQP